MSTKSKKRKGETSLAALAMTTAKPFTQSTSSAFFPYRHRSSVIESTIVKPEHEIDVSTNKDNKGDHSHLSLLSASSIIQSPFTTNGTSTDNSSCWWASIHITTPGNSPPSSSFGSMIDEDDYGDEIEFQRGFNNNEYNQSVGNEDNIEMKDFPNTNDFPEFDENEEEVKKKKEKDIVDMEEEETDFDDIDNKKKDFTPNQIFSNPTANQNNNCGISLQQWADIASSILDTALDEDDDDEEKSGGVIVMRDIH